MRGMVLFIVVSFLCGPSCDAIDSTSPDLLHEKLNPTTAAIKTALIFFIC